MLELITEILNSRFVTNVPWIALLLFMWATFFTISGISALLYFTWHYINDSYSTAPYSHFTKLICKITQQHCADDAHFTIFILIIPLSVAIFFWQASIYLLLLLGLVYGARSIRRLQKKITTHIADLTMHKKQKPDTKV